MKFSYEDLLSGDSIPVEGVGHIRSPRLRELKPTEGIGIFTYNYYLHILISDKSNVIALMQALSGRQLKPLENSNLSVFDTLTIIPDMRQQLSSSLNFFMDEDVSWEEAKHKFITYTKEGKQVGAIDRTNFDDVRCYILQANYIGVDALDKPKKFASPRAQALWEEAQKHLQEEAKKTPKKDKRQALGNIVSKLCAAPTGYTLLNIYDLTIFQLYDQFFQYGYLRAIGISEMAFSNHGGKDFDIQKWLQPLTNT